MRRDGTFYDQQALLADLTEQAAMASDERAANRDAQRDWRQASISIAVNAEIDRQKRQIANAPFEYAPDEMHTIVAEATAQGQRPALLIAPFYQEHLSSQANDDAPHAFRVAVRRAWLDAPWANDLVPLDGLISRPLRNTDLDVILIQQALSDMPVVLVYGETQSNQRIWPSLMAWNIVESPKVPSLRITFPALSLPALTSEDDNSSSARLKSEDDLGRQVVVTAGLLGEWFHLVRYGRRPRLHQLLAFDQVGERQAVAAGLAAACDLAVERGSLDPLAARVEQSYIYAEVGLADRALDIGRSVLDSLDSNDRNTYMTHLRRLVSIFEIIGDRPALERARPLLESAAHRSVLDRLGWDKPL